MNLENLRDRKGFICDMDGVIYLGNQLLPGVTEFVHWLNKNNKQFLFLTNSSERSPRELRQKLLRMGLDIGEEHFYTSALATAAFLKKQAPGCTAYRDRRAGAFERAVRRGRHDERCRPGLCDRRRDGKLQLRGHHQGRPAGPRTARG